MQSKLTLRLDEELIALAKEHARDSGRSVSKLVADYFRLLGCQVDLQRSEVSDTVRSLWGALAEQDVEEGDYRKWLEDKYLRDS